MKHRFYILRTVALILLCTLFLASCSAVAVREEDTLPAASRGEDVPASGEGRMRVALTYDDGPHNVRTKQIVDELDKYGFHATFFVVGNRVDGSEYNGASAMRYAIEAGNEIGIHGYTHAASVNYKTCSDEVYGREVGKTDDAIREEGNGYTVSLFRPYYGSITRERRESSPYATILWDVDSLDWELKYRMGDSDEECERKVNQIVENVLSEVRDGSIILMHDIYESTYDATVILLSRLHEMGYEVVTVSELLGDPKPGTLYSRAE